MLTSCDKHKDFMVVYDTPILRSCPVCRMESQFSKDLQIIEDEYDKEFDGYNSAIEERDYIINNSNVEINRLNHIIEQLTTKLEVLELEEIVADFEE